MSAPICHTQVSYKLLRTAADLYFIIEKAQLCRDTMNGLIWGIRAGRAPAVHNCDSLRRVVVRTFATSAIRQAGDEQVAFVTGASRGQGLEFVRQLLQRPGQR